MYEIGGLRARLAPLTGEIVSSAALRGHGITGEERSGIPHFDLAEAGGKNPEALDSALADAYGIVESMLI